MTEADARTPGRRRTVPAGAFVVALMVAVALGVLAIVALASSGDDGDGSDQELRLAAGRFTERFLTFEHDALDEWHQDVLALSTPGFAEEVEEVESSLRTLIGEGELDATTQVTDVFVGEEERSAVDVVVIYDRAVRGDEVDRTETDRYVQLSLVRIDGEWLVDNVIDIASAGDLDESVTPDPPTTTGADQQPSSTTTTAAG